MAEPAAQIGLDDRAHRLQTPFAATMLDLSAAPRAIADTMDALVSGLHLVECDVPADGDEPCFVFVFSNAPLEHKITPFERHGEEVE